jgi:hypothetical protein
MLIFIYRNGNNDYPFVGLLANYSVAFCDTLPGDNTCGASTMATANNLLSGSCMEYLSGSSPVEDAVITYNPSSNLTNGSVTINYLNGQSGCPNGGNYGM